MPDALIYTDSQTGVQVPRTLSREERLAKIAARRAAERLEMIAASRRYAASDRTDPFALSRALSHIDSGVATFRRPESRDWDIPDRAPGYYDAQPHRVQRVVKIGGREMKVEAVEYRSVARP